MVFVIVTIINRFFTYSAVDDLNGLKVTKRKMYRLVLLSILAILVQIPQNSNAGEAGNFKTILFLY